MVISLDYERRWGVREMPIDGPYRANLLGVPASIRGSVALFEEFEIAATWATVGFLFARTRAERERYSPAVRPNYANKALDPYGDPTGDDEASDPLHYGASMIDVIRAVPRQEIATHTFSHFYCLARGATKEAFRSDLESVQRIMRETAGLPEARSIVFPRNEHNPDFDDVLLELGIRCFRGNPDTWMWHPGRSNVFARAARLADAYTTLGGMHTVPWHEIPQPNGTYNVRASYFLRPNSEGGRLRRIIAAIRYAARKGEVIHLYWHPHNFGVRTAENMLVLRAILEEFERCRRTDGMRSMNMEEAAAEAARSQGLVFDALDQAESRSLAVNL